MKNYIVASLLLCFGLGYSQVTLRITSIPGNTLDSAMLYLAGSINN